MRFITALLILFLASCGGGEQLSELTKEDNEDTNNTIDPNVIFNPGVEISYESRYDSKQKTLAFELFIKSNPIEYNEDVQINQINIVERSDLIFENINIGQFETDTIHLHSIINSRDYNGHLDIILEVPIDVSKYQLSTGQSITGDLKLLYNPVLTYHDSTYNLGSYIVKEYFTGKIN